MDIVIHNWARIIKFTLTMPFRAVLLPEVDCREEDNCFLSFFKKKKDFVNKRTKNSRKRYRSGKQR